ncbi:6460_t:CDS:2 [Entrophospora sp. SA101]|nr:6977_t:CDS:2 [Entrophospora sp. SA101]CAJ0645418.1 6460_t:CDS:2 [Entrophospora sp. SA101]CAJ0888831.1 13486_t:CDS:2 [Entrophospora sp. SA101]CAJ0902088.1 13022_t:CDS:2 [Entrophospora sp. SA101]
MSGLSNPGTTTPRKQSNASDILSEQSTPRGAKHERDDDGDDSESEEVTPGKNEKRAGRRKIKIEYIEDKSRRHITFSKRKAGIMKKAYELSTLTGTQVLLLVVSETGLVYTFTTPKLQPLVTKPEGKNLIQACLNAPDATPPVDNNSNDVYDADRKPQTNPNIQQAQPYSTLGINPYPQYSGIPNGMAIGGGIATTPYMSTAAAAAYPQYGNQHLNYATAAAQNHPYMQQSNAAAANAYWPTNANNAGNANSGAANNNNNQANSPNNNPNGAKYQNQQSDKK